MFNYINFIGKYIIEQVCILMTIQDLHVGSRLILEKCERIFHSISLLFLFQKMTRLAASADSVPSVCEICFMTKSQKVYKLH